MYALVRRGHLSLFECLFHVVIKLRDFKYWSEYSAETEPIGCVCVHIYYKELAPVLKEAGKSKSAAWVGGLETRKSW